MYKVILPRGAGKTTELLKLASFNNGILLVVNDQEAKYAEHLAKELHINPPIIASYPKWQDIYRGRNNSVFIDEVDLFLEYIFQGRCNGYSATENTITNEWCAITADNAIEATEEYLRVKEQINNATLKGSYSIRTTVSKELEDYLERKGFKVHNIKNLTTGAIERQIVSWK